MDGVSTEKAPSVNVVIPHFIVASILFLLLSVLIFFFADSFLFHYYQGHVLAITHLTALGWITMIIFGALYQLVPVIFETGLYSERIARINLPIYLIGLLGLVYAFWVGDFTQIMPYASSIIFLALILFSINILLSVKSANKERFSVRFIISAIIWLFLTALLGLIMALNHKFNFWSHTNFNLLKTHAHIGLVGWFLQLIIGVSSVLVPMFLVSHVEDESKLKNAFWLINTGLVLLSLEWIFNIYGNLRPVFGGLIGIGILFFLSFLIDIYKHKIRKLDIGMKFSTVAFAAIIIPLILGLVISFNPFMNESFNFKYSTVYIFSIFFAFITTLILGQTYKTLPFIIWLDKYQPFIGKNKIPMPGDLYSEKIAIYHLWTYIIAFLGIGIGIGVGNPWVIKFGAGFMVLTALLYLYNVLITVSRKIKMHPLVAPTQIVAKNKSDEIWDILRTVMDPEVEINIVDMGLIYKMELLEEKNLVNINMTLSTRFCPVSDSIIMNVMSSIMAKFPKYEVNVNLVFEPQWTPDLITEAGKSQLKEGSKFFEETKG